MLKTFIAIVFIVAPFAWLIYRTGRMTGYQCGYMQGMIDERQEQGRNPNRTVLRGEDTSDAVRNHVIYHN